MQNKEVTVKVSCFMLPNEVIQAAGIQEGDSLEITAIEGEILIKKLNENMIVCNGDCENCPAADDECDGDCTECPCFGNCN